MANTDLFVVMPKERNPFLQMDANAHAANKNNTKKKW